MKLLIATSNAGKTREMSRILKGLPLEIVNLKEFADIVPARETGKSFAANARIKAKAYHRQTGLFTLAEDSGLQVDYLDGEPGYRSARFAGTEASDDENLRELLGRLRGVKAAERTARFVFLGYRCRGILWGLAHSFAGQYVGETGQPMGTVFWVFCSLGHDLSEFEQKTS